MDSIASLSFARSGLLLLIPLVIAIAMMIHMVQRRSRRVAERLQSERLRGIGMPARVARPAVLAFAGVLAVIALAGPRAGFEEVRLASSDEALVIVLDTSQSMLADDVGASRLAASRVLIEEILSRYDGKVGLVVFEGSAEVVSPLTHDTVAVASLLRSIGAGELAEAGSDFRLALSMALGLLERSGTGSATILLVSDGESRGSDWRPATDVANEMSVKISTILVGQRSGSVIRIGEELFRDQYGAPVRTAADDSALKGIAAATGGGFFENPFGREAVARVASRLVTDAGITETDETRRIPRERFQIPLSVSLLLFVAGSFLNRGAE